MMTNLTDLLNEQVRKIQIAEERGRSASTLNRLWREYFRIEDLDAHATHCEIVPPGGRRRVQTNVLKRARELPALKVKRAS